MSNTKKIASIAFTGAAVAATTTFTAAGPAAAAGCIVKNAGVCYAGPIKAHNKGNTVLVDVTTHTTLTCKKAVASGVISNSAGPVIGHIKRSVTNWSTCSGPAGFTFNAHLTTSPKIVVTAVSVGGAHGRLSGNKISGKISGRFGGASCKATISGTSVPWKYVNRSHAFVINSGHVSTLHVKATSGFCAGAINVSDKAYFAGTYTVSVPAHLTIS